MMPTPRKNTPTKAAHGLAGDPERGRPIYTQANFDQNFQELPKGKKNIFEQVRRKIGTEFSAGGVFSWFLSFFPMIAWTSAYDARKNLLADLICGVTVAIFHVPQTFGYSVIVGVPAVNGLYTAMFPMLMYAIFGTSRHNSIGAFAVVCIMMSQVNHKVQTIVKVDEQMAVNISAATACLTGLYMLIFGALKLGGLTVFLSDQFVSGFTAGVSVHIATSQLSGLFGFPVKKFTGPFELLRTYEYFFNRCWTDTHLPTAAFSALSILIIATAKLLLDPPMLRRLHMPFPIEMLMVGSSILISKEFRLKNLGFTVVENIPNSLPIPHLPSVSSEVLQLIVVDALAIAIISFTINVSLARIWSRERGYQVVANQELFALGMANVFGAFFGCFPVGASVPRSSLQFIAGGKTQLVSILNSLIIAVTILAFGPLMEGIPIAILSAIIVVSLKKVFMQIRDFRHSWNVSKIDGHVWLVSFGATVFLNVQLGLVCGVIFSLLTLLYKIQTPKIFLLGVIPNTDFYVPLKMYAQAAEISDVKIFHFGGPLHFGNAESFRSELARRTCFDGKPVTRREENNNETNEIIQRSAGQTQPPTIILDFNRVTFVDGTSALVLKQLVESYNRRGINLSIAACTPAVYSMLRKVDITNVKLEINFFPTIHDAVMHASPQPTADESVNPGSF